MTNLSNVKQGRPVISDLRFSHFGMFVCHLGRMETFYTKALGFTVTDRGSLSGPKGSFDLVFLSRDPDEHHQIVLATGRPAHLDFNPINQISLKTGSLATLRAFKTSLPRAGASELITVTHGNAVSIYCRDPEGNRLEIFVDLPWYVAQPLREPIDLDIDDEALLKMLEAHARSLPGFEPRAAWRQRMALLMGLRAANPAVT